MEFKRWGQWSRGRVNGRGSRPLHAPQERSPAVRDGRSLVSVQQFLLPGEGDVECFLNQERVVFSRLVQDSCFIPKGKMLFRLGMLCNGRLLRLSSSGCCLVFFQRGLQGPLRFLYVLLAAAAQDLVDHSCSFE